MMVSLQQVFSSWLASLRSQKPQTRLGSDLFDRLELTGSFKTGTTIVTRIDEGDDGNRGLNGC